MGSMAEEEARVDVPTGSQTRLLSEARCSRDAAHTLLEEVPISRKSASIDRPVGVYSGNRNHAPCSLSFGLGTLSAAIGQIITILHEAFATRYSVNKDNTKWPNSACSL